MIATVEEPSRCGIDAEVDAGDGDDLGQPALHRQLLSPQRVDDLQPAGLQRRQHAGGEAEHEHEADAEHEVARREVEDRQEPAGRIAAAAMIAQAERQTEPPPSTAMQRTTRAAPAPAPCRR